MIFYWVAAEPQGQELADRFEAEYGIPVEFVRLATGAMTERYAAEAQAGAPSADLIVVTYNDFIDDAMANGWAVPVKDAGIPDLDQVPDSWFTENGTLIVLIRPTGIAYNTDRVAPEDVPTSWEDLADPKWRGEIINADPRSSFAYIQIWDRLLEAYGEDYLAAMGEQEMLYYDGGASPALQALGAGEAMIAIPMAGSTTTSFADEGLPLGWVMPDVTSGSDTVLMMSAGSRSPNTARLFAHFLIFEGAATTEVGPDIALFGQNQLPSGYDPYNSESATEREATILDLLGFGG